MISHARTALAALLLTACSGGGGSDVPRTAPWIRTQSISFAVYEGDVATFMVWAGGSPPLAYAWYRNGSPIAGATGPEYSLSPATLADSGASFKVVITNDVGHRTSNPAVLTVKPRPPPPVIVTEPTSLTVPRTFPATFAVSATSAETLAYQWEQDGADLPGAIYPSYTLHSAALADSGAKFRVKVKSVGGTVTSATATLTVTAAQGWVPAATLAPADGGGVSRLELLFDSQSRPVVFRAGKAGADAEARTVFTFDRLEAGAFVRVAAMTVPLADDPGAAEHSDAAMHWYDVPVLVWRTDGRTYAVKYSISDRWEPTSSSGALPIVGGNAQAALPRPWLHVGSIGHMLVVYEPGASVPGQPDTAGLYAFSGTPGSWYPVDYGTGRVDADARPSGAWFASVLRADGRPTIAYRGLDGRSHVWHWSGNLWAPAGEDGVIPTYLLWPMSQTPRAAPMPFGVAFRADGTLLLGTLASDGVTEYPAALIGAWPAAIGLANPTLGSVRNLADPSGAVDVFADGADAVLAFVGVTSPGGARKAFMVRTSDGLSFTGVGSTTGEVDSAIVDPEKFASGRAPDGTFMIAVAGQTAPGSAEVVQVLRLVP